MASSMSVSMIPGATALTSTPFAARSRDSARQPRGPLSMRRSSPAGQRHPRTRRGHVDDAPPPSQQHPAHDGAHAVIRRVEVHGQDLLPPRAVEEHDVGISHDPALFTRMSAGPSAAAACSKNAPTDDLSATSHCPAHERPPLRALLLRTRGRHLTLAEHDRRPPRLATRAPRRCCGRCRANRWSRRRRGLPGSAHPTVAAQRVAVTPWKDRSLMIHQRSPPDGRRSCRLLVPAAAPPAP